MTKQELIEKLEFEPCNECIEVREKSESDDYLCNYCQGYRDANNYAIELIEQLDELKECEFNENKNIENDFYCSNCKSNFYQCHTYECSCTPSISEYNFCPNCGARIRREYETRKQYGESACDDCGANDNCEKIRRYKC